MAEEDDSQEKTEDPSQRKLDKASEEGRILSSKEMFVFTGIAIGWLLISSIPFFGEDILQAWSTLFIFDHPYMLENLWLGRLQSIFWSYVMFSILVGIPILLVVLLTQAAVGGINFAPKAMAFKGNKLNPISGLKRIISVKGLVELGKSLLKVILLFGIGGFFIHIYMPQVLP